jgi:putative Mn2+ efflux pump MntP
LTYFSIGAVILFVIGLVVVAAAMDKEDMQDND